MGATSTPAAEQVVNWSVQKRVKPAPVDGSGAKMPTYRQYPLNGRAASFVKSVGND